MAELRHSSSLGSHRSTSSSPREEDSSSSSPHVHDHSPKSVDDDGQRHPSRDRDRPIWWVPLLGDDLRASPQKSKVSIFLILFLAVASLISVYGVVNHLNAPYLCKKDGIVLNCPHVKESASRWETPLSATTSWKPCAERRIGGVSDVLPENETNGYVFIHAEGGLNQQRIAVRISHAYECNSDSTSTEAGPNLERPNEI